MHLFRWDILNGLIAPTNEEIEADVKTRITDIWQVATFESNEPSGVMASIDINDTILAKNFIIQRNEAIFNINASGPDLDNNAAYFNINRKQGSYTIQPITIVVDKPIGLLLGLGNTNNGAAHSVKDDLGNQYYLMENAIGLLPGTYTLNYRTKVYGPSVSPLNSINKVVTIVGGIVSVNNPTGPLSIGSYEESDISLRARMERGRSANAADRLANVLSEVEGVTNIVISENKEGDPDANGTPGHTAWVIVEGGANQDIADAIYSFYTGCSGLRGQIQVNFVNETGAPTFVRFDRPLSKPIDLEVIINNDSTSMIDINDLKTRLISKMSFRIGQKVYASEIATVINQILAEDLEINAKVDTAQIAIAGSGNWVYFIPTLINEHPIFGAITITINP